MGTHPILMLALVLGPILLAKPAISGTHWIVLPDKITPSVPLPITFNFYNTSEDVMVKMDLLQDDHHSLVSLTHTFANGEGGLLQMQVPADIGQPNITRFTLLVHGLSGVYFQQHARLNYDSGTVPKRFAVHIQLDKAVYKPGQTINFRTFGVYSDMTVFNGRFNVDIYDPKGNHMKKLANVTSGTYGVLEDFMLMDEEPVLGTWLVESRALRHRYDGVEYFEKSNSKIFQVDKYVLPKFDVNVNLPSYVVTTDKEMQGSITAKYTYGKPVIGTANVTADINYNGAPWKYQGDEVMVKISLDLNGNAKFTIPFDQLLNEVDPYSYQPLVEKLAGYQLIIRVKVTESLNNVTREATGSVLFYKEPFTVSFARDSSPTFFKPGLPYVGHIKLTQADGRPVISNATDVLLRSYVKFYDKSHGKYRAHTLPDKHFAPSPTGIIEFMVDPPENATSLHLQVEYKGLTDTYDMTKPSWLIENGNLQLSQVNSSMIGEVVDFQLLGAVPLGKVFYYVITNDHVTLSGALDSVSKTEHIHFQVRDDMKPYSKLIVYYFTTDSWNADSIHFVAKTSADVFQNKISMSFDKTQAEPAENVSLQISTDADSLVNILAVDQSVLLLATGNDITQFDVITSLRPNDRPSQNAASMHDPKQIMQTSGIQVLSDVTSFSWAAPHYKRQVDCFPGGPMPGSTYIPGRFPTYVPGVVPTPAPGMTYAPNVIPPGNSGSTLQEVKHTRENFPETWLWTNIVSDQNGAAVISATVPDTITSWYATAFSVNALSGLGITDGPSKFTTFRPFFVSLNLPYSVVRGEQVVLQSNIFNYMGQDLDVTVTLDKSDDFDVIQNKSGHVTYQSMDVVTQIHVKAGAAASVFVPIVPRIVGQAEISVKAQSPFSADGVKRQLKVEAEGKKMHYNVPLLISELNPTDVVLAFPDNLVPDSQKIQVAAIGDIMGPTVKNLKSLLRLPTGCGEQTMTSFAPDVFVYNYLQASNQLTPEIADMAKHYMNRGYQRELTFQRSDGSFSIWGQQDYQGSMWLTAFVLKSFSQAHRHIFVSDNMLRTATTWISYNQNSDGSFRSVGAVHSTSLQGGSSSKYSLTAFVLIGLLEAEQVLKNEYRLTNIAAKARGFLELHLANLNHQSNVELINDTYDLAITAYALAKAGSVRSFDAYTKLKSRATTTKDGKMFWRIPRTQYTYSYWESFYARESPLSVEATAYALLYLVQTRQLSEGMPLVKWLVTQRNSLGGFTSTQDTVIGLEALSAFGYVTTANLDLNIDVNGVHYSKSMHVTKQEAMVMKLLDVPSSAIPAFRPHGAHTTPANSPLPSISLEAHGHGSALVQVSVSFNVETEPAAPAFNLTSEVVQESLHSIVVKTCARYLYSLYHGPGMAVVEIDMPTGFEADLESKNSDISLSKKSEIRDQKTVVLYYDEIGPYGDTCSYVEMIRSDLVANLKPAPVRVFDYYEPERFKALAFYESSVLRDSSFCDICADCGC
ncbi:CD109 antigen-like isoform X1 [Mya arenaria]|uniref:CD109 antigen-like isoform X1 n=1 Tax=Mya arenaria TaxID=6604 RepID=UPI0022E96320|nr:CD109 antigen-like isoform X1 [Mya arenaria]XP_052800285.1 CD109 antigen-like isoform X1 [Mya arenaria]